MEDELLISENNKEVQVFILETEPVSNTVTSKSPYLHVLESFLGLGFLTVLPLLHTMSGCCRMFSAWYPVKTEIRCLLKEKPYVEDTCLHQR